MVKKAKIEKEIMDYDDLALMLAESIDGSEPDQVIAALKALMPDFRIQNYRNKWKIWFADKELVE